MIANYWLKLLISNVSLSLQIYLLIHLLNITLSLLAENLTPPYVTVFKILLALTTYLCK